MCIASAGHVFFAMTMIARGKWLYDIQEEWLWMSDQIAPSLGPPQIIMKSTAASGGDHDVGAAFCIPPLADRYPTPSAGFLM